MVVEKEILSTIVVIYFYLHKYPPQRSRTSLIVTAFLKKYLQDAENLYIITVRKPLGTQFLLKRELGDENIKEKNVHLCVRMRMNIHPLGFRLCFDTLFSYLWCWDFA
jgi:hypothetical protein